MRKVICYSNGAYGIDLGLRFRFHRHTVSRERSTEGRRLYMIWVH